MSRNYKIFLSVRFQSTEIQENFEKMPTSIQQPNLPYRNHIQQEIKKKKEIKVKEANLFQARYKSEQRWSLPSASQSYTKES